MSVHFVEAKNEPTPIFPDFPGTDKALYSADGMRRCRFTPSDLGGHGGPGHGHFEFNGGRNIHVPLTDLP